MFELPVFYLFYFRNSTHTHAVFFLSVCVWLLRESCFRGMKSKRRKLACLHLCFFSFFSLFSKEYSHAVFLCVCMFDCLKNNVLGE